MLTSILITVAAVLILAGLLGLKMKTVGKRLIFLCMAEVGMVVLGVAELNTYGVVGGCLQGAYRLVALIPCLLLFYSICKKNQVTDAHGLDGIGRKMPYAYAALVICCALLIGIPVTGTFTGVIYSEIGLLAGNFGVFTYVGLIGNVLGVVVPAVLLFPLLRRMYFPCKEDILKKENSEEETLQISESSDSEQTFLAPSKGLLVASWFFVIVLMVFSLYQQPVLVAVSTVIQKMFS